MPTGRSTPFQQEINKLTRHAMRLVHAEKIPIASVNGGTQYTLLQAVPGWKYRILDYTIIAIGGTTAGGTNVILKGTQSGSSVSIATVALAQLTRGAANKLGGTITLPTDTVGNTDFCDSNTPITFEATGTFTGNTHFFVEVEYQLEKAY